MFLTVFGESSFGEQHRAKLLDIPLLNTLDLFISKGRNDMTIHMIQIVLLMILLCRSDSRPSSLQSIAIAVFCLI